MSMSEASGLSLINFLFLEPNHPGDVCTHRAEALSQLFDRGVLALRSILPQALAAALCRHVDEELDTVLSHPEARARRLADINGSAMRRDLLLEASAPTVLEALNAVTTAIIPVFEAWKCGCSVEELSCLVVDPGAHAQEVHPDTPYDDDDDAVTFDAAHPPLLTVFTALQPVTPVSAPTEVWPGTHCSDAHKRWGGTGAAAEVELRRCCGPPVQCAPLEAGDGVVMDSRLLHRGSAHTGNSRRRVLCISFAPRFDDSGGSSSDDNNINRYPSLEGSSLSILPCFRGRFVLRAGRYYDDLEQWPEIASSHTEAKIASDEESGDDVASNSLLGSTRRTKQKRKRPDEES